MKSSPSAYLKVACAGLDPARNEQHLLVLDVHALDRADALREREGLRAAERLGRMPVAVLPDDRRVQALLDRGPDAEHRGEGVAGDLEVAAIADVDLVHVVDVVLGGVRGEDIGQAGVHAHAHERQLAAHLPGVIHRELLVAELEAGNLEGPIRMRLREAHGHVHVVDVRLERAGEDRHDELRVDRVHHEVRAVRLGSLGDVARLTGVEPDGGDALRIADARRPVDGPGTRRSRRGPSPRTSRPSRRCGRSPRPPFRHRSAGLA